MFFSGIFTLIDSKVELGKMRGLFVGKPEQLFETVLVVSSLFLQNH